MASCGTPAGPSTDQPSSVASPASWSARVVGGKGVPLTGIAVAEDGTIYFNNDRVQKFDATGRFLLRLGSTGTGPGQLSGPGSLAVRADGSVAVCDHRNDRIQIFDPNGRYIETISGSGDQPGRFRRPWGIAIDAKDRLYVSEYGGAHVQILERR